MNTAQLERSSLPVDFTQQTSGMDKQNTQHPDQLPIGTVSDPEISVDVLCIGHAAYDLVFSVPTHPGPDEKEVATQLVERGGGPAANAAVTVARQGGLAAFGGYLSQDEFGQKHFQELTAEGVLTNFIVRGSAKSPLSAIFVKPNGKRSIVNFRGQTPALPPTALDLSTIEPKAILFDGLEPDLSPPIAQAARERGIPTILDAGSLHAGTEALAPLVDYLVASERFSFQVSGDAKEATALKQLAPLAPWVVITLGSRGLVFKTPDGEGRLPAYRVRAVDTTGAGDAFHGAFALGIARGKAWQDLLQYSSQVAALTCTRLGARSAIPTRQELEAITPSAWKFI